MLRHSQKTGVKGAGGIASWLQILSVVHYHCSWGYIILAVDFKQL